MFFLEQNDKEIKFWTIFAKVIIVFYKKPYTFGTLTRWRCDQTSQVALGHANYDPYQIWF